MKRARLTAFGLGALGLVALIPCGIGGLVLTVYSGVDTSAAKIGCTNKLHNITIALAQYQNVHGSYPPSYLADADGKPMHSWRVLLLPYLDEKDLHQRYRFDEPWDGPNNRKLHEVVVKAFQCPAHSNKRPPAETSYVAVIGPKTIWPKTQSYMRDADIIDGLSNTIMVAEVAESGIHWMEPRDLHASQMPLEINAKTGQGISSNHPGRRECRIRGRQRAIF